MLDSDQGRLSAFLKWTELQGGGVAPTLQISRLVLLDVVITAIPEEEQVEAPSSCQRGAKGQSNIQLTWRVDSPINRLKANELQQLATGAIKEAVGLYWLDKLKEQSPFMPPQWLLISLVLAVIYAGQAADKHQAEKDGYQNQSIRYR